MKSISSRDNPLYKELKRLADNGAARRQSRRSVLDGIHLAQAYLQHVGLPLQCVVSDSAIQHPEVAPVLARCQQAASAACSVRIPGSAYPSVTTVLSKPASI